MTYNTALDAAIGQLHDEGRYRTFIDIERRQGQYPHAIWRKPDGSEADITVWCGNDYLGMGQNREVLDAMHAALEATGAGSGGTRNISGTTVYHKQLEAELAQERREKERLRTAASSQSSHSLMSSTGGAFERHGTASNVHNLSMKPGS